MESPPECWEDVARTHGRKIYNYAYRLTGNAHDAHDLTQDVLLRVRRGLGSFKPGSFDGWLWRITRNAFIDDVRRRQRNDGSFRSARDGARADHAQDRDRGIRFVGTSMKRCGGLR